MVNKGVREIINEAARYASETASSAREADIEILEDLREELGYNMKEVDALLGESQNWYSNRVRSGGTHWFTRSDYHRIKDLLEVEHLRQLAGVSENDISKGVSQSRGWYEDNFETSFPIEKYNDVRQFLLAIIVLKHRNELLDENPIERLVKLGIVSQSRLAVIQETVEIDSGDHGLLEEDDPEDDQDRELSRQPGELVRLSISGHSWGFQMKHELQAAGFQPGDKADFDLIWDDTGPMLVIAHVHDAEPAPPGLEDRRRTITERSRSLLVKPPMDIIEGNPDMEGGLGLDLDEYSMENPLYFEPLIQDGTLGLVPIAYEDGSHYNPL